MTAPLLDETAITGLLAGLHPDWQRSGGTIRRRLAFRNFARAMQAANAAGWLGEREGHHPDIGFGWGYCDLTLTSHEAGGLTAGDFALALKLDRLFD